MRTNMSRREAIAALLGGSAALLVAPKAHSVGLSTAKGCLIESTHLKALGKRGVAFFQPGERLITTTGDHTLDRSLGRALVRLSEMFSERPGFGFIDDSGAPNAYATDQTQVPGTWGTVCFGQALFKDLMDRYQDRGLAVMAVAAHEFGHIAQFRSGVDAQLLKYQPTVKRVELHADFLSGYFLGVRKRQRPSISVWAAGHTLYRIGDYEFHNPNHHGTPDQRVTAAETGFKVAYDDRAEFGSAFSWGIEYILTNF